MAGIWTKGVLPRVQWGPVITGVLCALAAQIVLGLFGIAFGFAAAPAGRGMAVLAGIWGILTPIVASFIGALIAVRVAGDTLESGALLDGALVWCIGLIAGALFLASAIGPGAMNLGAADAGTAGAFQQGTDAARGAAARTGVAAVAALLGLGGALLGAAVGRGMVTGEGLRRTSRRQLERRAEQAGIIYTERGEATKRPPEAGERRPPEEHPPGMPH